MRLGRLGAGFRHLLSGDEPKVGQDFQQIIVFFSHVRLSTSTRICLSIPWPNKRPKSNADVTLDTKSLALSGHFSLARTVGEDWVATLRLAPGFCRGYFVAV